MLQAVEAILPSQDASGQLLQTMEGLRNSLVKFPKEAFDLLPSSRMLKVHYFSRTNGRKPTVTCPEIVLRGNWLEKSGFTYDDRYVHVITLKDLIIITPE